MLSPLLCFCGFLAHYPLLSSHSSLSSRHSFDSFSIILCRFGPEFMSCSPMCISPYIFCVSPLRLRTVFNPHLRCKPPALLFDTFLSSSRRSPSLSLYGKMPHALLPIPSAVAGDGIRCCLLFLSPSLPKDSLVCWSIFAFVVSHSLPYC